MAEVKLGQLAQQKGSSSAVKDFGKRMERDHSKANDELKEAASKNGLTLPTDVDKSEESKYNRLSGMTGAAFDKAYARDMVTDHQKDISEFEKEARSGKDADLKNFASKTLPTLQEHLKMAQDMEKSVNSNETSKNTH